MKEIIIEKAMRLIAWALAANRLRTVASGLENIPAQGPALIVARHYHHLFDGLALFAALCRPFHIVVAMDWAQNRPTKWFFETINRLARWPIMLRADALAQRSGVQRNLFTQRDLFRYQRGAMRQSVELLVQGRVLVIFPEGYPNIDPTYTPKKNPDEFLPFQSGFVTILRRAERRLGSRVPVLPVGFHYAEEKPWIAKVNFGTAIFCEAFSCKTEFISFIEQEVKTLSLPQ